MGHAVSRKSSWVSVFSTTNRRDVSGTPQGLQKSRSAKPFEVSITSSLLAFARKPIERISKCRPPNSAPPRSQFESLPPELILEIERYLSLSSALCLIYTCRRYRQTMKARVEDLRYILGRHVKFLEILKRVRGRKCGVVPEASLPLHVGKRWAIVYIKSYMQCVQDHSQRLSVLFHRTATKVSPATLRESERLATYSVEVLTHRDRARLVVQGSESVTVLVRTVCTKSSGRLYPAQ